MEFSTTDQREQWLELVGTESWQEAGQWVTGEREREVRCQWWQDSHKRRGEGTL